VLLLLDNLGKSAEKQSESVTHVFNEVEWITIFFFIGLFMVIAGVEHAGVLRLLANKLVEVTGGDMMVTGPGVPWPSAAKRFMSLAAHSLPFADSQPSM